MPVACAPAEGGGTNSAPFTLDLSPLPSPTMSLIVTGTIGIDTIHTPDGEVREEVLGGSASYFAAAASFYQTVRMVAAVGDDLPPEHMRTLGHFKGVDTGGLEVRKGSKTFRWGGKYAANMDHRDTLFTELGVLLEQPPAVPSEFKDSAFVFLANTAPAVQMQMLEQFPNRLLAVADTMDLWINTARKDLEALIRRVDGLVLNYDEAELFAGKRNTISAAKKILELGPKFVVVKKGEHGCLFIHRDGIAAMPAYPAEEVVDPTGAGDSFAGGMMGHIARTTARGIAHLPTSFDVVRRALAHGTVMASFTIESFSLDRLTRLKPEEIDARFDEFVALTSVA